MGLQLKAGRTQQLNGFSTVASTGYAFATVTYDPDKTSAHVTVNCFEDYQSRLDGKTKTKIWEKTVTGVDFDLFLSPSVIAEDGKTPWSGAYEYLATVPEWDDWQGYSPEEQ